jgi:fibronectin-binding autotransporter adhesin
MTNRRSFSPLLFPFLALAANCPSSALAVDFFWNPASLSGTWDTTAQNWAAVSGGVVGAPAWTNAAANAAFFDQAGPYTVTIGSALTAGNVNFTGAGTLTLARSATSALTANTLTIGPATTLDIGGVGDGLFKAGITNLAINGTLTGTAGPGGGRLGLITGTGVLKVGLRWANNSNFAGNIVDNGAVRVGINGNGFSGGLITLGGDNTGATGDMLVASNTLRLTSTTAVGPSYLRLEGGTSILELTAGDLTRNGSVAAGAGGINLAAAAGFVAIGADRTVTLAGGAANALIWGSTPGFSPGTFLLGRASSTHTVKLVNPVNLNGATRTVQVENGAAAIGGELSGTISGGGASGLNKTGAGTLVVSGANSYSDATLVTNGVLRIKNDTALGSSATAEAQRTSILSNPTGVPATETRGALEIDGSLNVNEFIRAAGTGRAGTGAIRAISGTTNLNGQIAMEGALGAIVSFGVDAGAVLRVSRLYSDAGRDTNFEKVGAGTLVLEANDSNAYVGNTTVAAGTLQVGDGGTTGALKTTGVTNNAKLVFSRSNAYDYTGVIAGTGSLTQSGGPGSVLTLSSAQTYTGDTVVTSGTLDVTGSTSSASAVKVASGGTLKVTGSVNNVTVDSGGSITGPGTVNGNLEIAGTLLVDISDPAKLNIAGALSATGPVNVVLVGAVSPGTYPLATFGSILSPANLISSYRGATFNFTANSVSLTVGAAVSLDWNGLTNNLWDAAGTLNWRNTASPSLDFQTNDTVRFLQGAANPDISLVGDLRPLGITVDSASTAYSFGGSGAINGGTGLTKNGASTLTITAANAYTGDTLLTDGRLRVGSDQALGLGALELRRGQLSSDGPTAHSLTHTTLTLGDILTLGNAVENGPLTLTAAAGTLSTQLALTVPSAVTIAAPLGDAGLGYGFTKTGAGQLTLIGAGTFTGPVSLDAGRVRVGSNSAIGTGPLTLLPGSVLSSNSTAARVVANNPLTIAGNPTFGDTVDNGTLTLSGAWTLDADKIITPLSPTVFSGAIDGPFGLTKAGNAGSAMALAGTNSYTGPTKVDAGSLRIFKAASLPDASTVTVANGASLEMAFPNAINGTMSTPITLTGNGVAGSRGAFWLSTSNGGNVSTYTFNGDITLAGGAMFGSFGVTQTMVFGGAIKGTGNLTFNVEGAAAASHSFTARFNTPCTYDGNTFLTSGAATRGFYVLGVDQALPSTTRVNLNAPGGAIIQLNLNGRTQTLAGLTNTGNAANASVIGAGVLTIDNSAPNTFAGSLGGAVGTGTFDLVKSSPGTLILSGTNTYTGQTIVSAGTLVLNAANSGGGTVTVSGGATLAGKGSTTGELTVSPGGIIAPGDQVGTFAVQNNAVLQGTYLCEVNGTAVDTLAVTGNLDLTGATFALAPAGTGATENSYVIATYTGTLTGTFTAVPALPAGVSLDYTTPGQIKLRSGSAYDNFASVISNPAQRLAGSDPDNDGLANAIEFVLGGTPNNKDDNSLLPTAVRVTANVGNGTADYLKFTFSRTDVSAYLAPAVEYDADLTGTWTTAVNGSNGVVVQTANDAVAAGVDRVDVYLPTALAAGDLLFARLRVTVTP